MMIKFVPVFTYRPRGQTCGCQGVGTGRLGLIVLLHLKWISSEVLEILLYSIRNYIESRGIEHEGK